MIAGLNVAVIDAVGLCTSTVEADELNVTVPLHGTGSAASAGGAATMLVRVKAKVAMTALTSRCQLRRT